VTRLALAWCVLVALYVAPRVAAGLTRCPTFDECWDMEYLCERTPKRAWKPCRAEVAKCFRRFDRCAGGWSL